ncbi:VOC family protein [Pedococcus sp. KACC 23699]|uniref:VOC family protein n=1 Tax=Pedococcus sp. KACC 23699 TaxID=3149228 RepID=A0AAU7JVQ2_9MICO
MHRSRIGIVLVDHGAEHYDQSLAFWAGVQGVHPRQDGPYASVGEIGGLNLEVQRLEQGGPRVHLDIESDDVRAEVARLTALGATVVEERDGYVVMADPGGVVFCVVGIQTGDRFVEDALEWP